jgi:hypothetical protein
MGKLGWVKRGGAAKMPHRETQELLIDASKEVGLEVNAEKAKQVLMSLSPECRVQSRHKDN